MTETYPWYRVKLMVFIPFPVLVLAKKYKINRSRVVTFALIDAIEEYEQLHGIQRNMEPQEE